MTKIYLVRHAEAEGNLFLRCQGHIDTRVTPRGEKQIAALKARFASVPLDACYSSDLKRARQTAQALCEDRGLILSTDKRFREVNFGPLEDMPYGQIEREFPGALAAFTADPYHCNLDGMESFDESVSRFLSAMDQLAERHAGKSIAIASHGSVLRNVLIALFYGPENQGAAGHSDNTAVSLLEHENGTYRLVYANDNSHLDEKISTIARQNWWKEEPHEDYNLWFKPFDLDHDTYLEIRRDAWQTIYGTLEGCNGEGFYEELCNIMRYHPYAAAYAMYKDEVAGFIQLTPARRRDLGVGYVGLVYMCPQFRNKGIGAQLIGYAVSQYRRLGRTSVELGCAKCNSHGQHFYEKLGFRVTGTVPGLQDDLLLEHLDL